MPTISVPRNIRNIAHRAIEYNMSRPIAQRAAYKDDGGDRVPGTGMRTARRLVSGKVDLDQLKLMKAWFARHGDSEQEAQARQDQTSKAAIAWALWGGSPARAWVNRAIKSLEG